MSLLFIQNLKISPEFNLFRCIPEEISVEEKGFSLLLVAKSHGEEEDEEDSATKSKITMQSNRMQIEGRKFICRVTFSGSYRRLISGSARYSVGGTH